MRLFGVLKFSLASGLAVGLSWPLSWLLHTPEVALVAGAVLFVAVFIPLLALLSALSEADIDELTECLEFSAAVSKLLEVATSNYKIPLGVLHPKRST